MNNKYADYYSEGGSARYDLLRLDRDEEIELTAAIVRPLLKVHSDIIEIGCGTGRYGSALRSLGHTVAGLDISFSQLVNARQKLSSLLCADATMIPARADSFQACLAVLVLHQLSAVNRLQLFREVSRVLSGDGVLAIKTCSHDDLSARWVESFFPSAIEINRRRYPSLELLREELSRCGFVIEDVVPTRTVPSYAVADLLLAVEQRHNTTLQMIPADEFDIGLSMLRDSLADIVQVDVPQAHTHVLCRMAETT